MLGALQTLYETLKATFGGYTTRKVADAEEIVALKKENEVLLAEQAEAVVMIEEMAKYLQKH